MTLLEAWEKNARLAPVTIAILREHCDLTARSLGLTLHYDERDYVRGKSVYGPAVTDRRSYARKRHEFGHTQTRHAEASGATVKVATWRGWSVANTSGEQAAWTWARAGALEWTDDMQDELRRCLVTYRPYAKHGAKDRIWLELDRVGDRLTLGHAQHQLDRVGRLRLEDARKLLANTTR